ncbi:MAG: nuclear transport factor 2 family protein [Bacteroidota bacterium]
MKNAGMLTLVFLFLAIIGCDKENDVQPEAPKTTTEEIELNTSDQQAIFSARQSNNQAIKDHDAAGVAAIYVDTFFILTSTNGIFTGKERVEQIYQSVFDSREEVLFVRTPTAIKVNSDWSMASEHGNWVGTWKVEDENIKVGGDYYAKWHKIDGQWSLRSEVYTQFDCEGESVCSTLPTL